MSTDVMRRGPIPCVAMARRRAPRPIVEQTADGYIVNLEREERDLVLRLLSQLRDLLVANDPDNEPLLRRLFPPAFLGEQYAEQEAEYQRFMREELVASRLAAISAVDSGFRSSDPMNEDAVLALMQALNAVRLVLGTLLDVGEDHDATDVDDDDPRLAEHHLFAFLGWLVQSIVTSVSGIE